MHYQERCNLQNKYDWAEFQIFFVHKAKSGDVKSM